MKIKCLDSFYLSCVTVSGVFFLFTLKFDQNLTECEMFCKSEAPALNELVFQCLKLVVS